MKLPPVITRSARRRRVAFTIRPEDGRLEVLAPLRASAAEIERIIAHNPDLIERLRRQFEQVEARRTVPEFREGGEFHYLGTLYPVRFTRKVLAFDRAFLIPAGDEAAVRTELEQLYRKLAAELLEPKVSDAAGQFGLTYRHVRVGGARGRWGSCSRDGGLNFSWAARPLARAGRRLCGRPRARPPDRTQPLRTLLARGRTALPGYRQLDRFLREHVPEYCPW